MDDVARKQIADGGFQNVLLRASANLEPIGNSRGEFHQRVIEKWNAAFDGGRHAHLILLHEQLDEIGFLVGVECAREG